LSKSQYFHKNFIMSNPLDTLPSLQISHSSELWEWLQQEKISIAFTTYQTNRLIFVGSKPEGGLSINEQIFDKPMGLYAHGDSLLMSTRYQIWRLDNCLLPGETHQEADRLYVPSQSYTTGDLNVHDVVLDETGTPLFINTDFSCLATLKLGYRFAPVWQPAFISKLLAEDRCHLNGLAMVDGKPTYVTACSATNNAAGWRDHRLNGGVVIHIPSSEIIATNLSMPHSPRWYQDKLWLLNAGTGELGYLDKGEFVAITFCPGFVRGLAFWGDYALVGMSKLRSRNFTGLGLETRLQEEGKEAECGLLIVNIKNGEILHWLRFERAIEELFDVVVLPGVRQPKALGFENEDIQRLINFPGSQGIITSKPTVKRPSLANAAAVPGMPKSTDFKFQQVYHLHAESLAPYDAYTFPSLQARWQSMPQRGELSGVSASLHGDMVGFAIAELLPNFQAEVISLFVAPAYRHQGICTRMMMLLEQELLKENAHAIEVIYSPTILTKQALEPMLQKLGWQSPTLVNNQLLKARKEFVPPSNSQLEEGKQLVKQGEFVPPNPDIVLAASSQLEEGKQLLKQGEVEKAIICFQTAINIQPDCISAYNQLGNAWQTLGKFDQAIAAYHKLLEIDPSVAAAHYHLGLIWESQKQNERAISAYQQAIQVQHDFVLAHYSLGALYFKQKQFSESESYLQQALELKPERMDIGKGLSHLFRMSGDATLGRQATDRYLANCRPEDRMSILNALKTAYSILGLDDIAQTYLQQIEAILLQPNIQLGEQDALCLYVYLIFTLPYLRDSYGALPYRIQSNGYLSKMIGEAYIRECLTKMIVPEPTQILPISSPESSAHLRIGIISKHFRRHSVGWCSRGIIKEWSKLTPHLYLYVTDDSCTDDITAEFKQMTDNFRDFSQKYPPGILEQLRADNLDILIDMDSVMNPPLALILYHAPAKAVISWLGCEPPYISSKNYYLCDRHTHPESVKIHYQEQLLWMPDFAVAVGDFPATIVDRQAVRRSLNIADKDIVYLCVTPGTKVNSKTIRAHIQILQQVPHSILLHKGHYDLEIVRSQYHQECLQAGIDTQRCRFMPRQKREEDHRIIYQIADVGLDTYPYNGGTHNLESLWFNLPIVTLCGQQATSRMGYSFLKAVGIREGVAQNWQEYIDWGVKLGTNADLRHQLQQRLRQSQQKETLSPLWNPQKFAIDAYNIFKTLVNQESAQSTPKPDISPAARSQFEQGKKLAKQGEPEQAIICFQAAIDLQPDYIPAYNQLGNTWQTLGKLEEAINSYHKLLEINPNVVAAHCNLGAIWQLQNQNEKAITAYQQAIELKPDFIPAYLNLGKLLTNQGHFLKAQTCLQTALQLNPDNAEIHYQLGNILRQTGDIGQAIAYFKTALKIQPNFPDALLYLGFALMMQAKLNQVEECFRQVLTYQPNHLSALVNLGNVLKLQQKYPQALAVYEQALILYPEETYILYELEDLKLILCQWDNYHQRIQTLKARIFTHLNSEPPTPLQPLILSHFPFPLKLHQTVAQAWVRPIISAMNETKALCAFKHNIQPTPKLRIGYVSADFRQHPVGILIAQIFQHHDRTQFEVYGYNLVDAKDEFTAQIAAGCDVFVNIADLSTEAAARRIHADGIHILIDLLGYTTHSRPEIFALQPAPIQIQYLGYPDTMGADFIQYILADRWLIPPDLAPYYSEEVLELPHAFVSSSLEISETPITRADFGLPADSFVYCCFNRTNKFDPHCFQIWMQILAQVPNSVLWLIETSPQVTQTLRQIAQQSGISPERLIFTKYLPFAEYLAAYRLADLFLDTFIYNAGATAVHAFWSGLPLLTCPGETFASRMAASICAAAGLEQLICDNWSSYEQQAVHFANHPQDLADIRAVLQNKEQLPLFQIQEWVSQLESVYHKVWQKLLNHGLDGLREKKVRITD
jgi:uncharacterized protein (TIGR03032 family)